MPGRTAQEVSSDAMKNRFRHAVVKVPGPMLLDVDRGGPDFPFWAGHQCHSWPENSPKIGDLRRRSPNSLVLGLEQDINWIIDADIQKFFDTISWEELRAILQ